MVYKVFIEKKAEKDLMKIPKQYRKKIIQAILKLKSNFRPANTRKISQSNNYYRIRVGDYRIVYEINDNTKVINIFRIRHRKEAYLNL